jgi:hypothetical protein
MLARAPSRPTGDDLVASLRKLVPDVPESPQLRAAEIALSEARAERQDLVTHLDALRAQAAENPRLDLDDEIETLSLKIRRAEKRIVAARGPVSEHREARLAEQRTVARRVLRPIAAEAARDALPIFSELVAEIDRLHAAVGLLARAGVTGRGDTPIVSFRRQLAEIERGLKSWAEAT